MYAELPKKQSSKSVASDYSKMMDQKARNGYKYLPVMSVEKDL
jgi:hypothetical protein